MISIEEVKSAIKKFEDAFDASCKARNEAGALAHKCGFFFNGKGDVWALRMALLLNSQTGEWPPKETQTEEFWFQVLKKEVES